MGNLNQIDQLTALEVVRRANAGDAFNIIEAMVQTNQILLDMPAIQANDGTIHNTVIRTSQRAGTKRLYNQGIAGGATTTKTIFDRISTLQDYSVVDADLVKDSGNPQALLMSEDIGFLNGMGATQADDLIHGDFAVDPSSINGFMTRYPSLADTDNVLNAGGTGTSCTSVYVCALGPRFCHLLYPKGAPGVGVSREDLGRQNWVTGTDGNGKTLTMPAFVRMYTAKYGLAIPHPKAVKRICNIASATTGDTIVDKIVEALWKLPEGTTNVAIYANVDVMVKIDKAGYNKANAVFTKEDPWGNVITHVRNGRCRVVNAITSNEQALS